MSLFSNNCFLQVFFKLCFSETCDTLWPEHTASYIMKQFRKQLWLNAQVNVTTLPLQGYILICSINVLFDGRKQVISFGCLIALSSKNQLSNHFIQMLYTRVENRHNKGDEIKSDIEDKGIRRSPEFHVWIQEIVGSSWPQPKDFKIQEAFQYTVGVGKGKEGKAAVHLLVAMKF